MTRVIRPKVWWRLGFFSLGALGIFAFSLASKGRLVLGEPESTSGLRGYEPISVAPDGADEFEDALFPESGENRRLEAAICLGYGTKQCKVLPPEDRWLLFPCIVGLLYFFVGIAIVCDELFVPALEIIAEQWELSNDVAGATLMAAGGSAPELATSMIGTFKRSDVGFGTIVGSAVFNVLFVIGMCAMFTPADLSPLPLTWWPLFRDCCFYIITLSTLAIFMQDKKIEIWESIIQFCLYIGYVLLMWKSEKLEIYFKTQLLGGDLATILKEKEEAENVKGDDAGDPNIDFNRPSTFRAGVLQLLTHSGDITETAGVACVTKIKGDVNQVFKALDQNDDGIIQPTELKRLLLALGTLDGELTDEHVEQVCREIDKQNHGYIAKSEFIRWYTASEERIKNRTREIFEKFDHNNTQTISVDEIKALLEALGHHPSKEEVVDAEAAINLTEGQLNFQDFEKWYHDSLFWTDAKAAAEEAAESQESMWEGVTGGFADLFDSEKPMRSKMVYVVTLPLCLLFCLIPDCRVPGKEGRCYMTFIGSIVGIGFCSYFMVELAEIIGSTLGIPEVVMGLTILAAGTSVPDLLSSVIVARQGEGDMAVSSSIGSNVFDVTVGLPLPWMAFNIVAIANNCDNPVLVGASGLFVSLLILVGMIAAIVVTIAWSDWKMTQTLGWIMFMLYFAYVGVSLGALTPAKDYVVPSCDDDS